MLTYSFTNIGNKSLYQHLYNCIKQDITTGNLESDTKLPSKRSFAKNLGVSVITVETAYQQLQAEGYIYSLSRKGFFVSKIENNITSYRDTTDTSQSIYNSVPSIYIADFVSNKTNVDTFPFSLWTKSLRETISDEYTNLLATCPCGGVLELREAICAHLHQFRNMDVKPEQVIIGSGTEYLYSFIIQLLGRDKIYAIENPGYKKLSLVYKYNNVKCQYISLDKNGININDLNKHNPDIVHITPSHHYPTGIVSPIGRRMELLNWASQSSSRYIIEDDYDSEFRMTGNPIPTLQSIDQSEKVIYMNTFSKSLTPTIRIGYMVLPNHLTELFYKNLSFYSCTVPTFDQFALARFIENGAFERHINRMRTYYKKLRNELLDAITNSPLSDRVTISEENAGLHFLLHVNSSYSDKAIVENAEKLGIRISCLSEYYFHNVPDSHTLIMNYSGVKKENLKNIIELLCDCI